MDRVAALTEFFPASNPAIPRVLTVNRDSAPRRAWRWAVQSDVGELRSSKKIAAGLETKSGRDKSP